MRGYVRTENASDLPYIRARATGNDTWEKTRGPTPQHWCGRRCQPTRTGYVYPPIETLTNDFYGGIGRATC